MKVLNRIYIMLSKPFPKAFKEQVKKMLMYGDIKLDARIWVGFALLYSALISIMLVLAVSLFVAVNPMIEFLFFLIFAVTSFFIIYFLFSYVGVQRARQVDAVLPDALQLIAANIRAGMTPDKALFLAARPEFGILSDEIMYIGEETVAGVPLDEALLTFAERVDSFRLKRVVELIVQGLNAGGELASLLERTADDIRMGEVLQQEIQANIGAYVLFTMIAILIAAPVLYSMSINFVSMSSGIRENVGSMSFNDAQVVPQNMPIVSVSESKIDIEVLRWFSIINLAISAFFGSLLVGVLRYGEEREGYRNIPLFILVSLGIFFSMLFVMSSLMSSLFAI